MANEYQDTGKWKNPDTGVEETFTYIFSKIESFEDAVAVYGSEKEACRHLQRMNKVDARNTTASSEKAKAGFGAPKMSEEEKAHNKAQNKAKTALFNVFKGKSRAELENMGVPEEVIAQLGL